MDRQAPVFVKVEDYKDVLDILDLVKNKINDAKETIHEINDLKNQEDNELQAWANEIYEIEKSVEYIDQTLFEPENV
ncbi:TPA: hypothetical protein HA265_05890 [Candidatus Woesearchaeota archaeon]|nr:hypothetical protein [Candidatus Woesearchaeota archaeon]